MNKKLLFSTVFSLLIFAGFFTVSQFTKADIDEIDSTSLSWENAIKLTNGTTTSNGGVNPKLAVSENGKNIILVFMQKTGVTAGEADPYFSQSNDFGKNWSNPSQIHISATDSYDPGVAIDQSLNGHAVWLELSRELWYSKQTPTWSPAVKIYEPSVGGEGELGEPMIVASGNNTLDIVWSHRDSNGHSFNIYHTRSTNGGTSWATPAPGLVYASPIGGASEQIDATIDTSGNLHVVWKEATTILGDTEIFYGVFNGTEWLPKDGPNFDPINISDAVNGGGGARKFNQPSILVQGNKVQVAFENREGQSLQNTFVSSCANNCTVQGNWNGQITSTKNYSVKGLDPAYLNPQLVLTGSCPVIFFSSMDKTPPEVEDQDKDERIRTSSGCEGWNVNKTVPSVQATLGTDRRAILPNAISANGWYVHLAYERKENSVSNIFVTRNIPRIYLPVILK